MTTAASHPNRRRRIAWAPDGQSLYAAIEETSADIVSIEGLLE